MFLAWTLGTALKASIWLCPLYLLLLASLTSEWAERHALYAHKARIWWHDLNVPEQYGFAKNQVTPFIIETPDGEKLHSWHVLPLGLYAKHEDTLIKQTAGISRNFTQSEAFRLLSSDPDSRLLINFHGNAATIAQGLRTDAYRAFSSGDSGKVHVLAVDYRGYGYSTGTPSERGLIVDGIAVVNWALTVARIPPERIVILGQSLGTAVAIAVAEHFALAPSPVNFCGVVIVAGFSDVPKLLLTYAPAGLFPLLGPLSFSPTLQMYFASMVRDKWRSVDRLFSMVRASKDLRLFLIHARDDLEISWKHSDYLFHAAANGTSERGLSEQQINQMKKHVHLGPAGWINIWNADGRRIVHQEIVYFGGHNRILTYAPVTLAILKAFGL